MDRRPLVSLFRKDPCPKEAATMGFANCYEDVSRAGAYATLEFANTYHLAFRDLPGLIARHVEDGKALDFGCGSGRSTRFVARLGFSVVGVDVSEDMLRLARSQDPSGHYRLVPGDDLGAFAPGSFDLITALFPFDNIPNADKARIFSDLGRLLKPTGVMVCVGSRPEIYTNEWASFTTKGFPENAGAGDGDVVRIVTTDHPDARPVEDILCGDDFYRRVFEEAGLTLAQTLEPLARGDEPYAWLSETRIAPWVIYVLKGNAWEGP